MAITVGTDVYISVADADAYWLARNNTTWSGASTGDKEKALLEATQYLDGAYSFIGTQIIDNPLAWPRYDVTITYGNFAGVTYDSSTVPQQIKNACAELALDALSGRLIASESRGGAVKREKVDVIEVEYMDWAPSGRTFGFVSMMLKGFTISGSNNMKKLVRT